MKYRFRSREQVLESPLFDFASPWKYPLLFSNRCTHATRLEDMIYHDLHGANKGSDLLQRDVFQMLYTHDLHLTEPEGQTPTARELAGHVLARLSAHERFPALKAICEGQDSAAYEAAVAFTAEIAAQIQALKQSVRKLLRVLDKLENRHRVALSRLSRLASCPTTDDKELIATACETASTAEQIRAVTRMIRDTLHGQRAETERAIAAAVAKAQETAALVRATAVCWGDAPGAGGKAQYDSSLMQRVRDNEMLQGITRQLGRMKELLSDLRKNAYAYGRGEKYALTLGRDLKNVLSGELGLLAAPETTPLFLRRYNAKSLRQYARRDRVRKGGGDIIVCLDESGSTEGETAVWAKALALALQDICAHEERRFALIHFSSASEIKTDLFLPGKYDRNDLIAAAEHFFDGGTDFEAPMREALRVMEQESFQDADIVFITDGVCDVSDSLADELQAAQAEKRCSVIGLLLDADNPGQAFSLEKFCERVYRVSEMTDDTIERKLFSSLTA